MDILIYEHFLGENFNEQPSPLILNEAKLIIDIIIKDLSLEFSDSKISLLLNKKNRNFIYSNNHIYRNYEDDVITDISKKIKKNDKVLIKKVFFLKPNVSVRLRLLNSDKVEIVNNYRFGKWYLVSHGDIEGFIFSDFISVKKKINKKFIRYRHIDSVDWRKNKVDPQKNIELVFKKQNDNAYILQGYAWHYLNGFSEINYTFQNNILSREKIIKDGIKIFLFDENEIFVESDIDIFTGIYKKY